LSRPQLELDTQVTLLTEPADVLDGEMGGHRQYDNEKNSQHRVKVYKNSSQFPFLAPM
jgi:hypothetical protein